MEENNFAKLLGRYNCFCHGCGKEISYSEYHKNLRLYDMGCCNRCVDMFVDDKGKLKMLVRKRRRSNLLHNLWAFGEES